ncbi:uncharacterized protein BCR38DRAFT_413272 [Pseudomassariella vexata]|uniref:DUF6987 domain-containing protein n=1 Tax=Pseudomassariella vexata TaxID=1141098 RepID=A0A1Y2DGK1_9PEZI|nr:uncharacterized protein BCR38DRAFT_413272 [Pseudomassariella vexata]ORY58402.1 hypothetical protein BCR38DRAFT_413272 [Pseudomassariella vexata]
MISAVQQHTVVQTTPQQIIKTDIRREIITIPQSTVQQLHQRDTHNTPPGIMSSVVGDRGGANSPLNETANNLQEDVPSTKVAEDTAHAGVQVAQDTEKSVPRSIPDVNDSESQLDQSNEGDEGEMVPAAGRINENGEVIDDDGQAIGKVTTGDAKEFVGFVVTQEGDVLDNDGGVVGKAEPLEDVASELGNYTTKSGKEDQGEDKTKGGPLDGVGKAVSGVVGDVDKAAQGVTGAVGDTTQDVTDTVGDASGTPNVTHKVGDTVKVWDRQEPSQFWSVPGGSLLTRFMQDATDKVGETGKGVTDVTGDATKTATDTTGEAIKPVEDTADKATSGVTEDITDKVETNGEDVGDKVGETTEVPGDKVEQIGEDIGDKVGETTEVPGDEVEQIGEDVGDKVDESNKSVTDIADTTKNVIPEDIDAEDATNKPGDVVDGAKDTADGGFRDAKVDEVEGDVGAKTEDVVGDLGSNVDEAQNAAEGVPKEVDAKVDEVEGDVGTKIDEVDDELASKAEGVEGEAIEAPDGGDVEAGEVAERVDGAEGKVDELAEGEVIQIPEFAPSVAQKVVAMFEGPFTVKDDGQVTDQNGRILGRLAEGQDYQNLIGKNIKGIDAQGNLLGDNDTVLGKVDLVPEGTIADRIKEEIPEAGERLDALAKQKLPDISVLEGLKINKAGNVVDKNGNLMGRVSEGDVKRLIGKEIDAEGQVWDGKGNVIGKVEVLPEAIENLSAPFEDFPDATVDKYGKVIFEGRQVGVVEDFDQQFIGKKVDADGDILDKNGNVIGRAIRKEAEDEPEPEVEQIDYSVLKGKKVNKFGNVVDDKGAVWGHVVQGVLKNLVGKKIGDNGEIFNDAGQVMGKAEPIPEADREDAKEPAPFEDFPDAVVADKGKVMFHGEQVGIVVEGDEKKLKGKTVDPEGDILDKNGNQLGRAERWEAPEEEPEPEIDMSALAGKRINKAGNAVDSHGDIYGRVIEGDLKRLIGKMCDKQGFIRNEGGDVIGKCELIPEAERDGMNEGPFTDLPGCTVNKEGHVVTPGGDIVGRLTSGDPKVLFGRAIDDDGDILDKNGNVLGHAERWEPEETPRDVNPMSGRKVNREGNVVDENGDIIGKLTSGELSKCAGKKIDDDGDVVDQKGSICGHVSLLEDIPEPEPEPEPEGETEEQKEERLKLEQDRKIAAQICTCIEHSLDKIRPICKMITTLIDKAERTKEEERDEEELVKQVRPLIEEGGKILTEANGVIRGLDPDGRISANAKHKTAAREATPEEYRLADLLKELTGTVTETIENAKRKIEDMPHAKKELNPLWGLLAEPLFQIIAAVGLLLSGVLGLVGKLLNGLGLGGLVNNLLGGLGITKVLDGLGLGKVLAPITGGGGGGKKKSGGGLLGGIL